MSLLSVSFLSRFCVVFENIDRNISLSGAETPVPLINRDN